MVKRTCGTGSFAVAGSCTVREIPVRVVLAAPGVGVLPEPLLAVMIKLSSMVRLALLRAMLWKAVTPTLISAAVKTKGIEVAPTVTMSFCAEVVAFLRRVSVALPESAEPSATVAVAEALKA